MQGIILTEKEGAIKRSVIKLNYIFTISEIIIKKRLFVLSKDKKKEIYDALIGKIKDLID